MTNIEKLETAIREALPELMELSYGVEVRHTRKKDGQSITLRPSVIPDVKPDEWEIIGHPVTLLHLLRWLDTFTLVSLHSDGYLYDETDNNVSQIILTYLDLSKPLLSQQSQEVIDNLVKLIP